MTFKRLSFAFWLSSVLVACGDGATTATDSPSNEPATGGTNAGGSVGATPGASGDNPAAPGNPGASGAPATPDPGAAGAMGASGAPTTGAGGGAPVGSGGAPEAIPPTPVPGGTPARPTLSDADAPNFELLDYLAQAGPIASPIVDNWDPTAGLGDVDTFVPTMTVAPGGSIQAAINLAVGADRVFIQVLPGTYREVVRVPASATPITLYSTARDAGTGALDPAQTVLVFDNLSGRLVVPGVVPVTAPACVPASTAAGEDYGTDASATIVVCGANFQVKNLTIANDADEAEATAKQAVALHSRGDRAVYENVALLGHQDTVQFKTPNVDVIGRTYIKDSYIEGDVDFIFGRGTAVIDGTEIRSILTRTGEVRTSGNVLAPSTDVRNPYGILVVNSTFTTDTAGANAFTLGRAWDEGQGDVATYMINVATGIFPNGQSVVRNSVIGPHINATSPWTAAATTSRPFSSTPVNGLPANRLFEFGNAAP